MGHSKVSQKSGKSILVIEDDRNFSYALSSALTEAGYQVVTSARPNEALVKLARQKFSCILLDLQLENYSGLKVIQQVRHVNSADTFNFETPIILMSGQLQPDVIHQCRDKVQAILAKPFDLDVILAKVDELATTDTDSTQGQSKRVV